jgi:hypothetical protein
VVQTAGFKDGLWLDRSGSPMTDAARMTERFRRVNYGKLEIEITIDDPKARRRGPSSSIISSYSTPSCWITSAWKTKRA